MIRESHRIDYVKVERLHATCPHTQHLEGKSSRNIGEGGRGGERKEERKMYWRWVVGESEIERECEREERNVQ